MKKEDLFDAVGNADMDLLIRSEKRTEKDKRKWWNSPWAAVGVPITIAAVLISVLAVSLPVTERTPQETPVQTLESGIEISELMMRDTVVQEIQNKKQDGQYPSEENFEAVMEALGAEYEDMTVQEAAQLLVPWVEEHQDIAVNVVRNSMHQEVVWDDGTSLKDGHYWNWTSDQSAMTIACTVQDAVNLLAKNPTDPVYQTSEFAGQQAILESEGGLGGDIWCEWDFYYSYHVEDPQTMTVSERNRYLKKMNNAIEAYLEGKDVYAWMFMTQKQLEEDLAKIAENYSNEEIRFAVDSNLVYFGKNITGGNELELPPSFQTVTVLNESDEKVVISENLLKTNIYLSLKQAAIRSVTASVEAMGLEAYQEVNQETESWQLSATFWLDDVPCELYDTHLKIGDEWYQISDIEALTIKQNIEQAAEKAAGR